MRDPGKYSCNLPYPHNFNSLDPFFFHSPRTNRNVMNSSLIPVYDQFMRDLIKFNNCFYLKTAFTASKSLTVIY